MGRSRQGTIIGITPTGGLVFFGFFGFFPGTPKPVHSTSHSADSLSPQRSSLGSRAEVSCRAQAKPRELLGRGQRAGLRAEVPGGDLAAQALAGEPRIGSSLGSMGRKQAGSSLSLEPREALNPSLGQKHVHGFPRFYGKCTILCF